MKAITGFGISALLVFMLPFTALSQGGTKAPNFSLKSADGKTVELAKLKGKVVVVNFWATWCGPCRKEIPDFIDVYKEMKDNGVEIVGISLDREGWDVVKPFLAKNKINYPIVVDAEGKSAEAYGGINAIPTTFVVGRDGTIAGKHIGMITREQLKKLLASALKG